MLQLLRTLLLSPPKLKVDTLSAASISEVETGKREKKIPREVNKAHKQNEKYYEERDAYRA